jgi:site-specific DNA-methyltransferase (adenine-specific)/modification methylase
MRVETIGPCTLYLGDCLEILPQIGKVDALVTDPPYGVLLGETASGQERNKNQAGYIGFSDTPEYIRDKVVPAVKTALSKAERGIITPGKRNLFLYPPPDDIGVWFNPAGTSIGRWGYSLASPILYYGKTPRNIKKSGASSIWGHYERSPELKKTHPCPKPLKFMTWAVNKASLEGEIVLDPFMGIGTAGVACVNVGRRFIGIEIEERYFDAACKRIETAASQGQFDFDQ